MLYFAYGSNMSTPRLQARVPAASLLGTGCLQGYTLAFHKVSIRDGSGKCDASYTGNSTDAVFGVLYELSDADLDMLDRIEGVGQGYEARRLNIRFNDELVVAQTYLATRINKALKPMLWYKEHVLRGATEHRLPNHYIEYIDSIEAIADIDADRAAREGSIYR